uniref:Uncharacterized protein n=1 Tax=Sphaerodactylus townsendi TaxID=933632 RepID=A0ACB8EZB3_9SAUR
MEEKAKLQPSKTAQAPSISRQRKFHPNKDGSATCIYYAEYVCTEGFMCVIHSPAAALQEAIHGHGSSQGQWKQDLTTPPASGISVGLGHKFLSISLHLQGLENLL